MNEAERLRARITHLKKALAPFSGLAFQYDSRIFPPETDETVLLATTLGACRRAQEALHDDGADAVEFHNEN